MILEYPGLLSLSAMAGCEAERESAPAADPSPDAGYVSLLISPAMPGFVRIATSREDPQRMKWSLRTLTGITRFQSICAAQSRDCRSFVAQFQEALASDQIPHHPDLFKISTRFALQIFEAEARASSTPCKRAPRSKRKACIAIAAITTVLGAWFFSHSTHQETAAKLIPVYRHSSPQLRM